MLAGSGGGFGKMDGWNSYPVVGPLHERMPIGLLGDITKGNMQH